MGRMALPPEFDQPAGGGFRRIDEAIGRGQARVFRVLWFRVPPGSVAWNVNFQALLASRFLSDIALQALLYGALSAAARGGGRAFDAALIGTAYLLPGVLLGLWGGAVADPNDRDSETESIRRLNDKIAADQRITVSLLQIGDGLTLARRRYSSTVSHKNIRLMY